MFALPRSATQLSAVLPAVVIALTDQQRASNQLGNLTSNSLLTQAAQDAADDMATKGYFAHVSPSGTTPWDWLNQVGYQYQWAGENLAVNFDDSQQLMDAWMASPTHKANILSPNYTQIGVGMATGTYQGAQVVFVVQFFASPRVVAAVPPKTPPATAATSPGASPVPTAPTVAAAETPAIAPVVAQAPQSGPSPSVWTRILSSPRSYANDVLLAMGTFFALLLVLGLIPFSKHFLHPKAALNGLALVAVILGILVLNKDVLFRGVSLPTDTQSATVYHALQ